MVVHQPVVPIFMIIACLIGCQPVSSSDAPTADLPTQTATIPPTHIPESTITSTATPTPPAIYSPPQIIGPNSYPESVDPLTGLVVDDPLVLNRRPLLIKISNAPPVVRPQSEISNADVIFEHYAEGGWTRFTAIFYSHGGNHVGSVRSVRLLDLQLTPAFDGILIFSGGSLGVIDTLRQSPLYPTRVISPQFGYAEPTFVRFPREGLPFEHTLFTDTDQLWAIVQEREINRRPEFSTPGWMFGVEPPDGGIPATAAQIDYARTTVSWRYDPLTHKYLRWADGIPHSDAITGQQLAFDNVIVMSAYHEDRILFPEKYFGKEHSLYIELQGEGPATLLRDGVAFEGRWQRQQETDLFSFYTPDGKSLLLKPGQTFFQIIRFGFERVVIQP